jgi:predicted TIM-barrel fold metal-dependent hydrolase
MRIDFHTHIFPKKISQNREAYFRAEPAFRLLYQTPKSRLVDANQLLKAMDENQIDRSVVFGFPWIDSDLIRQHNDYVMNMAAKYSDRFIGFGCINPDSEDTAIEAERCLDGGLMGIGELAFYQSGIDDTVLKQLEPMMAICRRRKQPVLIHTNEPVGHPYPGKTPITLSQIYQLIRFFPKNTLVLAHWGGGLFFFSLLKKEVKDSLTNVYFDTAASPFLYEPEIYRLALKMVGTGKIIFGSDYPLLPPKRYFEEMEAAGLSKTEMQNICGRNAAKVLGI